MQETKLKTWQHGFTQPCVFDIHVPKRLTFCHFFSDQFLHQTTKSFKSLSFHLACGRRISLRHVVAIDPLIAQNLALMLGQCGSSSDWGKIFDIFEVVPTRISLLGSCNLRVCASVQERYINIVDVVPQACKNVTPT